MPWPTTSIDTTQLDADEDNPRLARPSLKSIADFVNAVAVGEASARALLDVPSNAQMSAAITAGVNEAKAYSDSKYYPIRRQVVARGGMSTGFGGEYNFAGGVVYSAGHVDEYDYGSVSAYSFNFPSEAKKIYFYKEKAATDLKFTDCPPVYYSTNGYSTLGTFLPHRAYLDQIGFSWIFNFESLSTSSSPTSHPGTEEFGHYNDIFNTGLYDMRVVYPATTSPYYGDTTRYKFGTRSMRIDANNVALELTPTRKWMPTESWCIDGWFNFSVLPGSGLGKTLFAVENRAGTFDTIKLRIENAAGVIRLKVYLSSNGSTYDIANGANGTNTTFSADQWYHIGLRYNAETGAYSLLFNGTRDYHLVSATKVFGQIGKIRVANDRLVGTSGFLGNLDGLCISPYARFDVGSGGYTLPTQAPSVAGRHFYDCNTEVMAWKDNGSRVYVGEMTSNSSATLASYKPSARSEYYIDDIAPSTNYVFNHNIGYRPGIVSVLGAETPDGDSGEITQHVHVGAMDTAKATVRVMGTPLIIDPEQSTSTAPVSIRVIVDRGW